eukprot:TRINITY_DN843_c0_g1_i4.p2 TRINITY_DN843_c0_g1~~TRINITY_DN843_c0_g1_i4.p2  ORF type:complete len:356 (-),score=108.10 TRINITY_DN843_c0_g1_i4:1190-2161(-)
MQPSKAPNTIEYSYECTNVLEEPYAYLLSVPGKGIRVKLLNAFNQWFKVSKEVVDEVGKVVQMLHTASLLIDDIEDNSKLRRGIPVAHLVYGVPSTINCANYMYFRAMEECTKLGNAEATQAFLEEMVRLHHGQGYDIFWRDNNTCPSEEDYIRMVIDKTGGLFRLGVRMLQAFSVNKTDYVPLVNNMGLFFQIRDDYMNLKSEEYAQNKSFAEDLSEGKFSFPIIHSVSTNPHDRRLLNILRQRPEDIDLKKYAVDYMNATGSIDYTRTRIFQIRDELFEQLDAHGGNEFLRALIEKLSLIDETKDKKRPAPALHLSTEGEF